MHGQIALGREGAHSLPRILHAGGDATGQHIENTLAERVQSDSSITVLEYTHAIRICVEDGAVAGVEVMESDTGERRIISGDVVIIASGGAGQLYRYSTNPQVATGDGVALAFLAGAEVMDMEFYQFHPTALWLEGAPSFLLSEAMRGEGAVLRNAAGQPFMEEHHPMADLAPRDVVSRAIASEMERADGRPALLDITHLPAATVSSRFPTIYAECRRYGLDITRDPIPVAPAAHYMMGGVRIDTWGRTNIGGLYACGEAACAAVHGANRLASNSLLDTLVFSPPPGGRRAGQRAGVCAGRRRQRAHPLGGPGDGVRHSSGTRPRDSAGPDVAQRWHHAQRHAPVADGAHPEPVAAHHARAGDGRRPRIAQHAGGVPPHRRGSAAASRKPRRPLPGGLR